MKTRQITELGLLLTVSLILAYLESLLPVIIAVPGVKLGLANVVTMLVLYYSGGKRAFFFMILRVVLTGILFSGISGIIYSFAGGICCIGIMCIAKRCSFFSIMGVSMAGAVAHNFGQILIAWIIMENARILYYFPILCVSGVITGIIVGFVSASLLRQINKIFPWED